MKCLHVKLISLCFLSALATSAYAGDAAQTIVSTDLKQEPFSDAQTITSLPASTTVDVLKRQGGWMQVKPAAAAEGWVKMTSIKFGGVTTNTKGDSGLGSLLNVAASGRSGNTSVTVATGVRGLSPEDLKNAQPNPEAVKKLDDFAATKSKAESLASAGKLSTHKIDYLADAKSSGSKK